jgi:hypothetical protein
MAKQILPITVRFVTRSAIVDGVIMGEDGDFWEAWNAPSLSGWWGRRVYRATVYPMWTGAPSFASPVVAVDAEELLLAGVSDAAGAQSAAGALARYKHRTKVSVLAGRIGITGTLHSAVEALVDDGKQREHGLGGWAFMTELVVRSLDGSYPFEMALPFAVVGARAFDVVCKVG